MKVMQQTISSRMAEAQAEVFWLAFQSLPREAQWMVCERLTRPETMDPGLAMELESWQAAASEALMNFEALLDASR